MYEQRPPVRSQADEDFLLSRRESLLAASAGALALALGPRYATAAMARGLKSVVSSPTFDVETHIDSLEWWGGEPLPPERPYEDARLAKDVFDRGGWTKGEPGYAENLERLRRHRTPTSHMGRAAVQLAELGEAGIDVACVHIVDHGHQASNIGRKYRVGYDRILADSREMRAGFPGRMLTFAGIDPRRGGREGAALLREAVTAYGCSGLGEVVFQQFDIFPSDRQLCYPLYEACVDLGVPFFGNCEGPAPETMPGAYEQVAKDFPTLRICLAGSGRPRGGTEANEASWRPVSDAIRLAETYENVYLDTADWQRRDGPQIRRHLDFLRRCFDGDARRKVMYASDYPVFVAMGSAKSWVDTVLNASRAGVGISDEEIALYYSRNAQDFLGSALK